MAVVGIIGSGKSSLLSALLGDMVRLEGEANVRGSVAFVPQQAWIRNATLRNNILFGKEFKQEDYDRVRIFFYIISIKMWLAVLPCCCIHFISIIKVKVVIKTFEWEAQTLLALRV